MVSAPSGAGKSTLCHEVRAVVPGLYYSVSYTTRAPRPGEVDGTDFHFVTERRVHAMRNRDQFAEWAEVHGHLYGTPVPALEGALGRGLDVLLDIDTHGARQLRQRYPEAVSVFIMAPSMAELEARLRERKSDAPQRHPAPAAAGARGDRGLAAVRLSHHQPGREGGLRSARGHHPGRALPDGRLTLKFPDVEVPE